MNESHPLPRAANTDERIHLLDLTLDELRAWVLDQGEAKYRAQQICEWIYQRFATSFDEMTNLSKALRARFAERAVIYRMRVEEASVAEDETRKLLLKTPDGKRVEAVWIPASPRHTACISSQIGCPVGCRFCASGVDGVERNLTTGEIVEQLLRLQKLVADETAGEERLTNLVMMGMGEPLANFQNVMPALRIINSPWGPGLGARRITVSTVGLPAQIRKLADEGFQFNLALSLHAPDDALRHELIPWGKGVPIRELLDACQHYFDKTGREITLEYVMLDGVNMATDHADGLAQIARRLRANVNLLRYNPVPGLPFRRPTSTAAYQFQNQLRERGVNAHVRTSRGKDVDAACGQLRRKALQADLS